MRWVATHPPEVDRTHAHRTQRELFEADKQRFMDKLTDLEKVLLVGKSKARAEPKDGPSNPSEQAEPPAKAAEHQKDRAIGELTMEVLAQFKAQRREREQAAAGSRNSSPRPFTA
jgi:hypothetical protein